MAPSASWQPARPSSSTDHADAGAAGGSVHAGGERSGPGPQDGLGRAGDRSQVWKLDDGIALRRRRVLLAANRRGYRGEHRQAPQHRQPTGTVRPSTSHGSTLRAGRCPPPIIRPRARGSCSCHNHRRNRANRCRFPSQQNRQPACLACLACATCLGLRPSTALPRRGGSLGIAMLTYRCRRRRRVQLRPIRSPFRPHPRRWRR